MPWHTIQPVHIISPWAWALGWNSRREITISISATQVAVLRQILFVRIVNSQTEAFIAGSVGVPVTGTAVVVNIFGQLGVAASSERFKDDIKPMDKARETLIALRPVTFRYKKEIDPAGTSQFGLVAEDVDQVSPDLVVRDKQGKA
jgi:hypothetical protein